MITSANMINDPINKSYYVGCVIGNLAIEVLPTKDELGCIIQVWDNNSINVGKAHKLLAEHIHYEKELFHGENNNRTASENYI
jgi:hypothetical protein